MNREEAEKQIVIWARVADVMCPVGKILSDFEATIRAEERAKPSCYCDTMTEHWKRLAALDARRKP